jgi:hypothetical protein
LTFLATTQQFNARNEWYYELTEKERIQSYSGAMPRKDYAPTCVRLTSCQNSQRGKGA